MSKEKLVALCKNSQKSLKKFLVNHLRTYYREMYVSNGYIYCKGSTPVCLVAHLDTVHKDIVKDVYVDFEDNDLLWSPQGIGGDDRCGVYALLQLKYLKPSLLFLEDEEIGGLGATAFCKDFEKIDNVNAFIEIDRRGNNDVVSYDDDNKGLTKIFEKFGYKPAFGSFSDISILCPHFKISGVNLSAGYYNAHTLSEYIKFNELAATIRRIKKAIPLIKSKIEYKESINAFNIGSIYNSRYGIIPKHYNDYYGEFEDNDYYYSGDYDFYGTCGVCGDFGGVYVSSVDMRLCEECIDQYGFTHCDCCNEVVREEDTTINDDGFKLCKWCANTSEEGGERL